MPSDKELKGAIPLVKPVGTITTMRVNLRPGPAAGDGVMGYPTFMMNGTPTQFIRVTGKLLPYKENPNIEEKPDRKELSIVIGTVDDTDNVVYKGLDSLQKSIADGMWGTFEKAIEHVPAFAIKCLSNIDHPAKSAIKAAEKEVEKTKQPPLQKSSALTARIRAVLDGLEEDDRDEFVALANKAVAETDEPPLRFIKGSDGIAEPGILAQLDSGALLLRTRFFHKKTEAKEYLSGFEAKFLKKGSLPGAKTEPYDDVTVDRLRSDELGPNGCEVDIILKIAFWVAKRATVSFQCTALKAKLTLDDGEEWLMPSDDDDDMPVMTQNPKTADKKRKATAAPSEEDGDEEDEW